MRMASRERKPRGMTNIWRWLLGLDIVIMAASLIAKIPDLPNITYIHLLVDYHFGFVRRGLIGALLSLVMDKVPPTSVVILGSLVIAITLALYLRLFRTSFGFSQATLPLFVLVIGSPFFFKNFIKAVGYFDIFGCMLAIVLLLVPARSLLYMVLATLGALALIAIHQIHLLLYIPTIGSIVLIRYFLIRTPRTADIAAAHAFAVAIPAAFVYTQFFGAVHATPEAFEAHLLGRMGRGGSDTGAIVYHLLWYRTIADEIAGTQAMLPLNLKVSWFYALLIALHAPLIGYYRDAIRAIAAPAHRRIILALLIAISLGYLVIFAVVYDYARWMSSWAVCMILMLHAVKLLPAAQPTPLIAPDNKTTLTLAALLTLIPRVGIVKPF